ncbi:hypothetical protein D1007_30092 [Hordeum vulgare]|nr:hypothetical protein D1007_30092 [Hordeum vulgare]
MWLHSGMAVTVSFRQIRYMFLLSKTVCETAMATSSFDWRSMADGAGMPPHCSNALRTRPPGDCDAYGTVLQCTGSRRAGTPRRANRRPPSPGAEAPWPRCRFHGAKAQDPA